MNSINSGLFDLTTIPDQYFGFTIEQIVRLDAYLQTRMITFDSLMDRLESEEEGYGNTKNLP